jgi:Domain of unknown function (DUF5655)
VTALDTINSRTEVKALYGALLAMLDEVGPHEVEVKKTSLHVTHGRAFLGVHPRSGGLLLNIVTAAPLADARVRKSEQISRNRCHNEVLVRVEGEVDGQLAEWIRPRLCADDVVGRRKASARRRDVPP